MRSSQARPLPPIQPTGGTNGQVSSSKGLDCLGLLTSFKTLLLKAKGFFCSVCSFEEGKSLLEGDRLSHPLPRKQSLLPALTSCLCNLVPALRGELSC